MTAHRNTFLYPFIILFFFLQVYFSPLNIYDEGIVLVNAKRLLQGETYLRDFWTIYPIGQFKLFQFWMRIFGESLLSIRSLEFIIGLLFGSCFYFLVNNLMKSSKTAIFSCLIFCYYINYKSDFLFFPPIYTAIICVGTSYLLFFNYLDKKNKLFLFLSFLILPLTLLFRIDFFVYSSLSYGLIILFSLFFDRSLFWKSILFFGISLMITTLACSIIFTSEDINLYFNTLIVDPVSLIKQYRKIPIKVYYYIYPLLFIFFLIIELKKNFGKEKQNPNYKMLLLIFSGIFFLNQLFNRADSIHSLPALFFISIIIVYYINPLFKNYSFSVLERVKYIIVVVFLSISVIKIFRHNTSTLNEISVFTLPYLKSNQDLKVVIQFIQHEVKKDDYLYIGVDNHDQFLINHMILYYFSQGKIPTKYGELHPGIANTKAGQEEIVGELSRTKPKFIITSDETSRESNKSNEDMNLNIIDNYISQHYSSYLHPKSHYKILIRK